MRSSLRSILKAAEANSWSTLSHTALKQITTSSIAEARYPPFNAMQQIQPAEEERQPNMELVDRVCTGLGSLP